MQRPFDDVRLRFTPDGIEHRFTGIDSIELRLGAVVLTITPGERDGDVHIGSRLIYDTTRPASLAVRERDQNLHGEYIVLAPFDPGTPH